MSYSTDLSFESERLHDLKRLRILDTAQDPLLDELTRMAAQVCEAPISLVSLVDQDRQWFKSRFGMDVTETPRSESFCSHAIAAHDLLLVEDATLDQRFAHLPAVLGTPAVRAYAGAPLVTKNGFAIGTICIVDHKPRQFTDTDKTLLTFLSKQVINYIENTNTLQDFQSKLAESHRLARLGEVGAKISHEMNTPLSIIVVRVAQVRRKIEQFMSDSKERTELIEDLNKVDAVVTRISKIIRGLNMYARSPESDAMEETDLTSIIEETLSFCRTRLWNDGVDLQLAPSASPIIVHCRPVQVSQILLNLMTNALDAVQKSEEKWIQISVRVENGQVELKVTDSGPAIPREISARFFEPFFTTKPVGVGTGLGLNVSQDMAKNSGGSLNYEPEAGRTAFVLRIPLGTH